MDGVGMSVGDAVMLASGAVLWLWGTATLDNIVSLVAVLTGGFLMGLVLAGFIT